MTGPEFLCAALDTLKDLDLMILRCHSVLKFCDLKLNFDLKQCCVQNATFEIRGKLGVTGNFVLTPTHADGMIKI